MGLAERYIDDNQQAELFPSPAIIPGWKLTSQNVYRSQSHGKTSTRRPVPTVHDAERPLPDGFMRNADR
jgi:hypothetical protein